MVLQRLMECLGRDRTKHQVAEVTSLGLVQMTRKKLGLGLLETFSEACEACQGRGVIVSHEPVSRSKSSEGSSSRRKKPAATPTVEPHQITDGARNAIAQIAKSTVGVTNASEEGEAKAAPKTRGSKKPKASQPDILDSVLAALPEAPAPGTSKRRRRASSAGASTDPAVKDASSASD
jgi:ribonuclease E